MHKLLITNINANAELNDCSYINCYYHEDINKIPSLSIILDKSRHIYLNKKYNILIVEIKNENVGNYFEYDFDNSEEDTNTNIKNEKGNLLCLLSLKGKSIINIEFLFGNLNEIKENEINVSCNFNKNCFGSPIINLNNNKLIGIFTSLDKAIILDYFLEEYFMNKNNANLIGRAMINHEQFNFKSQQDFNMNNQENFFAFKNFVKYYWQIYDEDKMRQNYFNNLAENQMSNQIKMKVKIDGGDLFKNIKIIILIYNIILYFIIKLK